MKYEMIPNDDKNNWTKTLAYFTNLYVMRKQYSEDRAAESGFKSAANVAHIDLPASFGNASFNLNTGIKMGNILPTQEDKTTAA